MHTYLPHADLKESAKVLFDAELKSQIMFCDSILNALHERDNGRNLGDPIVEAWRYHELQLSEFGMLCCDEWESRGNRPMKARNSLARHQDWASTGDMSLPSWVGKEWIHDQYRRLLINIDPNYSQLFPGYAPLDPADFKYPTA